MKKEYLVMSVSHSLSPTPQYSIIPLLGIYVPPKVPTCTYVRTRGTYLPYRRYLTHRSLGNTKLSIYIHVPLYLVASNNKQAKKAIFHLESALLSNYQLYITTYYPTCYISTKYAVVSGIYTGHVFPLAGLLSLGA